jgi:glycosyltransferase involved in cell wall biosynthesis
LNIGIYIQTAVSDNPRGIGLHTQNLVRELINLDSENQYYLYFPTRLMNGRSQFPRELTSENVHFRPIRFPQNWAGTRPRLWWDYWLPFQMRRDRLDVYHGPSHFLPALRETARVITIHDVAFFNVGELYGSGTTEALRQWTLTSLERADRVIALSQNTASDVKDLGVGADRIRTIYGGGNLIPEESIRFERLQEIRCRYGLPLRYILCVGTLHPRKNVGFILRAFAEYRKIDNNCKLVLVGLLGSAAQEVLAIVRELDLGSDVVITGYVESWELPLIYRAAETFVLPSSYEGFGMTVIEAMAYGVPVIAADTSCLSEVVGDAAILVPQNDVPALTTALTRVVRDASLRETLIEKGKKQCEKFSWRECARKTLDVYRELVPN